LAQDLQVLRDRLLRDLEVGGDLVDRARLLAHEQQDRPSTRLAQRRKRRLGSHAAKIIKGNSCTSLYLYTLPRLQGDPRCQPTPPSTPPAATTKRGQPGTMSGRPPCWPRPSRSKFRSTTTRARSRSRALCGRLATSSRASSCWPR